jgi:hypothetical protein
MFVSPRILAMVLAVAATQPLLALAPAEAGAPSADHTASADAPVYVFEVPPHPRLVHLSPSGSLARVVAFSNARMGEARAALRTISERSAQQVPTPSMLEELPLVASLRRRAGERWNTTDSSRPGDFALCYRFSHVMGFQVVPGDLTPSKLPTPKMLSVKNQGSGMGVLVGMTFRLGRAGR